MAYISSFEKITFKILGSLVFVPTRGKFTLRNKVKNLKNLLLSTSPLFFLKLPVYINIFIFIFSYIYIFLLKDRKVEKYNKKRIKSLKNQYLTTFHLFKKNYGTITAQSRNKRGELKILTDRNKNMIGDFLDVFFYF